VDDKFRQTVVAAAVDWLQKTIQVSALPARAWRLLDSRESTTNMTMMNSR